MPDLFDVVIVGSGAGGSMMAYTLTQAGARVAVVEAGGHNIDHDIRHHQWPWELPYRNVHQSDPEYTVKLRVKTFNVGSGVREQTIPFDGSAHRNYYNEHFWVKRRDWKYTFPEDLPYRWVRVRAIGGKTNCWSAGALRWGPIEWKPYSYDGYGIDWPISYDEIEPWYSKTERLIGVSGERADKMTATPSGEFQPAPPAICGVALMRKFARKLGYTATQGPRAIITRALNGRRPCHYCGRCGTGCDPGAKFTTVGTLLPAAAATGRMTMFTNAIVREVTLDSAGRASGVVYVDRYTFRENAVRGRYVVVAASAIETARLLLASRSARFPDGLANSSGQVGRNLVEDSVSSVSGYLPQFEGRPVLNEDSYQDEVMLHPYTNTDEKTRSKDFIRRYIMFAAGEFPMGGGAPRGTEASRFGGLMKKQAKEEWGSHFSVTGAGCGLENPNHFVDLDPEVKDAWGIPAVRIHLKQEANQEAMVRDQVRRGIELIEAAGGKVTSYSASPWIPGGQIHEQGTCRMGDDPKRFVTNRWGQTHDIPNLILADGSLHCTSGVTNPTLTILTLAMRNGSHLAEDARNGNA
jgi:choline dehydrogenase-like flavoprotein